MAGAAVVLFCVFAGLYSTAAQSLGIEEGGTCKEVEGVIWTCKPLKNCPTAQRDPREKSKTSQVCSFNGTEDDVCCSPGLEPSTSPLLLNTDQLPSPTPSTLLSPLPGIKSHQMCQKYADAVYIRIPDLMTDDEISYDTCAWREENTTRAKRIIKGSNSIGREFPHMALVGYQRGEEKVRWLCGGSLISDRFILSSGSCAGSVRVGFAKFVRLGDYNVKTEADEEMVLAQPTTYEITESFIHPEFHSKEFINDIALFKLNASVFFTEFIRPICLQTDLYWPDTQAIATGWGRTKFDGMDSDILKKANLTIVAVSDCRDSYKRMLSTYKKLAGAIGDSIICAGSEVGRDSSKGDTGGPLQVRLREPYCMYSQVGVTSFSLGCGLGKRHPGLYTRVSHFVPWIESVVWP